MSGIGDFFSESEQTTLVDIPAPLYISRKPVQLFRTQLPRIPSKLRYFPPRTSSVRCRDNEKRHEVPHRILGSSIEVESESASLHSIEGGQNSSRSQSSTYSERSCRADNTQHLDTTAASNRSSFQPYAYNLAETTVDMLGDFVAIDGRKSMENPFVDKTKARFISNPSITQERIAKAPNPYEFERSPLFEDLHRQTTLSTFIAAGKIPLPITRNYHVKNARSDGSQYLSPGQSASRVFSPTPRERDLQRSESSPTVSMGKTPEYYPRSPSLDIPAYYYGEFESPALSAGRKNTTDARGNRGRAHTISNAHVGNHSQTQNTTEPPYRGHSHPTTSNPASFEHGYFATDMDKSMYITDERYRQSNSSSGKSSDYAKSRPSTRSRSRVENVKEELDPDRSPPEMYTDMKSNVKHQNRSRSPMKKMFGENGWLGRSPSEVNTFKIQPKEKVAEKKQSQNVKPTMMRRIKTRIEGIAEKADFNPRNSYTKAIKPPVLAISLTAPEQARIYMELELMLVHTANVFLMTQFSQGRIAIDSIKRASDTWKSKGRPGVIEFMYDQSTQRDLVAINQHTFRFYGDRAGDGIRVNSMLYNWKQVASHMAIRTFCNADTVILKLLFDIGQILELLGAAEGILLRHQNIRLSVNAKVQSVRMAEGSNHLASGARVDL